MSHSKLPRSNITVIALEQVVAAPFCSRQLADLGARGINIERPKVGDFARDYDQTVKGQSAYFIWLNRSNESLTLDVKHPEAKNIVAKLIAAAQTTQIRLADAIVERALAAPEAVPA